MDNFASQLLNTLLALAFVLALAWVSIGLLKRLQQSRGGGGAKGRAPQDVLRFVRALPVGTKERVVVMHYRGEEWLLGVTGGGITLLARQPLDAAASPGADTPPTP